MNALLWSKTAESDPDGITEYIARDNVSAAVHMRDEIERRLQVLTDHPNIGRRGRVKGTRELVLAGTPYIAIYRVRWKEVLILPVLHGAGRWPPKDEHPS